MPSRGNRVHDLVINANNLSYAQILHDLNFTWHQGETIALIGPNGSGKSTLARLIAGLIEPTTGYVEITAKGVPLKRGPYGRWQAVGLVGQHPRRQCIGASVAEELSFGLINLGLPNHEVKYQVREIIQAIGMKGKENQSPATLSGGERQRLVVAAVLAMKPRFVVFDEALSMLDVRSEKRIIELLDKRGEGTGKLWITHDPELARKADRLWLLHDGRLWDEGKPENVLDDPQLRQNCHIQNRCEGLEARIKRKTHKSGNTDKTESAIPQSPVLQWLNIEIGNRLHLNKAVLAGEFIGIVGASGSGKSTLLESAIGLIAPSEGSIRVNGQRLDKKNLPAMRRNIRILLQEAGEYLLDRTVRQVIFWGEKGVDSVSERQYLERFDIDPVFLARSQETLSGGERQKVALAATLRTKPEVLLLDEPMLGLDAQGRKAVARVIGDLSSSLTTLYVTHDLCEVLPYANRLWLVDKGQVVRDCEVEDWDRYREEFRKAGVRIPI